MYHVLLSLSTPLSCFPHCLHIFSHILSFSPYLRRFPMVRHLIHPPRSLSRSLISCLSTPSHLWSTFYFYSVPPVPFYQKLNKLTPHSYCRVQLPLNSPLCIPHAHNIYVSTHENLCFSPSIQIPL